MKPTEKQIKVIDTILSIIKTWKNTNDIDSALHENNSLVLLINELEYNKVISSQRRKDIWIKLVNLLYSIQIV